MIAYERLRPAQHPGIEIGVPISHGAHTKLGFVSCTRGRAECMRSRRVFQKGGDGGRECVGVIGGHEQGFAAVLDNFRYPTDATGNNGKTVRHRLEQGNRDALTARRHHVDRTGGQQRRDVVEKTPEMHLWADAKRLCERIKRDPFRAVSSHFELRTQPVAGQDRQRLQRHVSVLGFDKPSDDCEPAGRG